MRDIFLNSDNINMLKSKPNDDFNIKRLLNKNDLDQSQCVRFGKVFEKILKDLIKNKNLELIETELIDCYDTKSINMKGKKDVDICFKYNNEIYYFESKLNLNLDSEKRKATDVKINDIKNYLFDKYKLTINANLITGWYEKESNMIISPKTDIYFMKDFFNLIGYVINKDDYYKILQDLGKTI